MNKAIAAMTGGMIAVLLGAVAGPAAATFALPITDPKKRHDKWKLGL